MKYTTTLKKLRAADACDDRYKHLKKIGKYTDKSIIPLSEILEHNGLDDAIWALRAVDHPGIDRDARLFACDCAASVLHIYEKEYPEDNRPRLAIAAARKYAKNPSDKNKKNMDAARDAAMAAAWAALDTGRVFAAWAARAAMSAASAAAWAARAAWYAARDAASAACYAARAACAAAWDAAMAAEMAAARSAACEKYEKLYRKYFC